MDKHHEELLRQISERLTRIEVKLDTACEINRKHDKVLYGNGTPGIRTQVYILWGLLLTGGAVIGRLISK